MLIIDHFQVIASNNSRLAHIKLFHDSYDVSTLKLLTELVNTGLNGYSFATT